jgi:hypothetical protein
MYYIRCLDVFRAIVCSSSGGPNCILQHLVCQSALNQCTVRPLTESDIPDAVKYNLVLLKMSILLLETFEASNVIHILQNKASVHQVGNKNKFIL